MEPCGGPIGLPAAQRETGEAAMEAAMPLIYLPLIMYASLMEFMAQPFRAAVVPLDRKTRTDARRDARDR
jgi:hypothetical protein